MASLYKKVINGKSYWYLREMAWVGGKPKMVSERYLGSAGEIAALLADREAAMRPERTRHLGFGDLAAVWGLVTRLGVVETIDEVSGARRSDAGASVGTYLALAACNRLIDPCSKRGFADWWKTTAGDRFIKVTTSVLDHRGFWDAMHAVSLDELAEIERRLALRMIGAFDLDISALALDMTNFATYIDTTNERAPIAARGKAKQKRSDLRLVGLGLVVTRDGGVPLVSHAYPGNRPDVTQFAAMIDLLVARYAAVATAMPEDAAGTQIPPPQMTVVFDAGQNSVANFAHLAQTGLGFVGSVPPSDCPELLALPAGRRAIVDEQRFGGLSAHDTRREVYGAQRRVVLTHSPTLHTAQSRGFDQTLAKATAALSQLGDVLARGKTRRPRDQVTAEITQIVKDPWVRRIIVWELTGHTPPEHRLTFHLDAQARTELETEVFGKRVLITDRDHWPVAEVVAGYRSQAEAEFSFRQLKNPTWSLSAPCTTGPTTTSASTSSPACSLCRSRTSCAATPTSTACTCQSASCSTPSPASKRPC
ncbi:MAG: IS1634 family transposase [Actinobacteria bacterium]|nr:IS1634 family transposase [Actinomycetota bacterium]